MPTSKSLIFRIFLVRDQEVGGSNPLAPTIEIPEIISRYGGWRGWRFSRFFATMPKTMPTPRTGHSFHRSANGLGLRMHHTVS